MNHTRKPNALDQYRSLLELHGRLIDDKTAAPIKDARHKAADTLMSDSSLTLPRKGDEKYEAFDINDMFAPDMGLNINRIPFGTDIDKALKCGLPALTPCLGIIVNDTFHPTDRLNTHIPEGVTVTSFSNAGEDAKKIINNYYATIAPADKSHTPELLNTALAQNGVLIHIAKGVKTDKPIQLINILRDLSSQNRYNTTITPVLAIRRILIVLEKGSSANVLLCDHDNTRGAASVSSQVTEIYLHDNASLNLYSLEESSSDKTGRYTSTCAFQNADSRLNIFSGTLHPAKSRNDFNVTLAGPGSELNLNGIAIVNENQTADNATYVRHATHGCRSDQSFKYLVGDYGRGAFEGLIKVEHDAFGTKAYQNNRNILASKTARMNTMPQLEIYCDDVKCSHGATSGQLDQNALFYMRSRGIDLSTAKNMLMNAFLSDVIDRIELPQLRDRLKILVEKRLSGENTNCQNCPVC